MADLVTGGRVVYLFSLPRLSERSPFLVVKLGYDDVETDFLEPSQVDDSEASNNGSIYL